MFDEHSEIAKDIMDLFEVFMVCASMRRGVSFKDPPHDIARRFLNEIVEFKPIDN